MYDVCLCDSYAVTPIVAARLAARGVSPRALVRLGKRRCLFDHLIKSPLTDLHRRRLILSKENSVARVAGAGLVSPFGRRTMC